MSVTYEMSTRAPAPLQEDVERDTSPRAAHTGAISGVPLWQVRKLVHLAPKDLLTEADVSRWERIHAAVQRALDEASDLIEECRAELVLADGERPARDEDFVPAFLRKQAD